MDEETTFNLSLPSWMASVLSEQAAEIGISRAALIKVILYKDIKKENP